jgi:DnaJ-class molecular chaperone
MEEQQYEDFHEYDDFFKNSKKFRKPKLGEDIYLNLSVSLQESVMGIEKELAFSRYEPCP